MEPRASGMLGKHSADCATGPALGWPFSEDLLGCGLGGQDLGSKDNWSLSKQGDTQLEKTYDTCELILWILIQAAVFNLNLEVCLNLPEASKTRKPPRGSSSHAFIALHNCLIF